MFDTVTAVSPWNVPAARRTQLAGGALLLHAAAVTAYLAATLWTIPAVTPPKLFDVFVAEVSPPIVTFDQPAPAPPANGGRAERDAAPELAEPAVVQPKAIADLELALESTNRMESTIASATTTASGDSPTGPGVDFGGSSDAAVIFAFGMTPPRILQRVDPVYPELARKAHRQGVVILEAEIGRDGLLRSARAVNAPLGFGLEQAALDALAKWRFAPALSNDRPVAVYYRLSVNFKLH